MISCLGLLVGVVDSPYKKDVLNQCARFLAAHEYLCACKPEFSIDGELYCTLTDYTRCDNLLVYHFVDYAGEVNVIAIEPRPETYKDKIAKIRRNYRRGFLTENEAINSFARVYALEFGVFSDIYMEMNLQNFDPCFED